MRTLVVPRLGSMLLLVSLLAPAVAAQALPAPATDPVAPLHPIELGEVGSGELLWRSESGLVPMPVVDIDVELSVTGIMVHGRLTQRFFNPTAEAVEAIYVFPLPDRAAVHHMEVSVGERRIVSVVREREQARKTYAAAKASGKKAALVDQNRGDLFTTSVANINPDETVSVVLEYLEEVAYEGDRFRLRFPLTFTPRFLPPAPSLPAAIDAGDPDAGDTAWHDGRLVEASHPAAPRASIDVRLDPGMPLQLIESDSHPLDLERRAAGYRLRPRAERVLADRDFLLAWSPSLDDEPRAAVFVEDREDGRYALVMLVPPVPESPAGLGLATETLFIVDVSSSMAGPSIRQARQALLAALDRLRPEDRFNILRFNDGNEVYRDTFRQATLENLDDARDWVGGLRADGGTMIYPALMRGLGLIGASRSAHAQRIVFLTDGAIGNEQEVLRAIDERLGETRLHTVGIGAAPNAYLMRKMAERGRGLATFIADTRTAENRIDAFLARLERPVMTDVELSWDGAAVLDVHPRRAPDLYAGQPLFVSARLERDAAPAALRLAGWTRSGAIDQTVTVDGHAARDSGIAARMARARIETLMDGLYEGVAVQEVRRDVVDIALDFNLVTRFTSLVAVEERPTALGDPREMRLAGALPRGGTLRPLRLRIGLILSLAGLVLAALGWWRRAA
jgi:Ca-activated chloride channel family protein